MKLFAAICMLGLGTALVSAGQTCTAKPAGADGLAMTDAQCNEQNCNRTSTIFHSGSCQHGCECTNTCTAKPGGPASDASCRDYCNPSIWQYGQISCDKYCDCGQTCTSYKAKPGHTFTDAICNGSLCDAASPNKDICDNSCECADIKGSSAYGDPHFGLFSGDTIDFHGGCDLVLIQNPGFADGIGIEVHIRTKIETWWSYIESAAIKLGNDILEITGDKKNISYWLNGVHVANMETGDAALGKFAVRFKRHNEHQSQTRIDLGHGNALSIETYKRFVRVNASIKHAAGFLGTFGMLGSYPEGKMYARDKATIIEDPNEFGQEWMVLPSEPKLFHSESAVHHPMACPMPTEAKKSQARRRLGEAMINEEEAAEACARVAENDRDACIFDVLATNDKDIVGSY